MYDINELFFYKAIFVLEILVAMHLFSYKLKRKNHFVIRLIFTGLICLGLGFAFPVLSYSSMYSSFMFLALFLFCTVGLAFCYDVSVRYVLFCAVTAYTAQHISHETYILLSTLFNDTILSSLGMYGSNIIDFSKLNSELIFAALIYLDIYILVYYIVFLIFGRKFGKEEVQITNLSLLGISAVILFVDILLNSFIIYIDEGYSREYSLIVGIYNLLSCFMVLYIQYSLINTKKLKDELFTVSQLLHQSQERYESSQENINLINLKCHDLKHQIREYAIKGSLDKDSIKEMENIISIYDSNVKTGNEALDLILTEKSLLCQKQDIKLTCLADCSKLSFISNTDLYSIFGNAIDNAIEAVIKINDKEKRNINLIVRNVKTFVSISVENYYSGEIKFDKDGLPITTKSNKDYHGFGMKSIKIIVEKYGGDMSVTAKDGIFSLNIMLISK